MDEYNRWDVTMNVKEATDKLERYHHVCRRNIITACGI